MFEMRKVVVSIFLIIPILAWGQEERKYIREGYKAYTDGEYNSAEIDFRKAEEANKESYIARYNTSAALYQQQKLEESGKRFSELLSETSDPKDQAKLFHNIGNVLMEGQQYQEAAEAYKKSLKLNPGDDDTRYNLAYALEKLRAQPQQQQQNKQDKNQQENKDNNKEQEKQEDQQQQKQEQQEQQEQQQEQNKQEMSQEEAERLLNAILQKERDVKEEVDKKKAVSVKIKTDKDW